MACPYVCGLDRILVCYIFAVLGKIFTAMLLNIFWRKFPGWEYFFVSVLLILLICDMYWTEYGDIGKLLFRFTACTCNWTESGILGDICFNFSRFDM